MLFFAYHRDEYLVAGESLEAVLAFITDCNESQSGEDAVVWQGGRVAAILRSSGGVIRFDAPAAPAPGGVADEDPAT